MQMLTKFTAITAAVLATAVPALSAQSAIATPPTPAPIVYGKTAFISPLPGSDFFFPSVFSGPPDRPYQEFYAGMAQWGRYKLVSDPKDADVIFALHFKGQAFVLSITNPEGIFLGEVSEDINGTGFKKTRDRKFEGAMTKLLTDLETLVQPTGAPPGPKAK